MTETNTTSEKKRILFSPIGNTDPIRECYDGACLHIVRHYHPYKVVLFFTKEMWAREQYNECYTRSIKSVAPDCEIELIYTDIVDAHLYDSFIDVLPEKVRSLRDKCDEDTEILLNLSSGTPQIKTMMAILTVEEGFRGIQVVSPNKGSNSKSIPVQAEDDVEAMIENNFDNEPDAENRCEEPPLQAIRYFSERQRLLSLIHLYEYGAAYELAKGSPNIALEVKKLLKHGKMRQALMTDEARKTANAVDGIRLFPNLGKNKKGEELFEYFLTLVIARKKGMLSDFLVKCNSYLFEMLRYYVMKKCPKLKLNDCMSNRKLDEVLLRENAPALLDMLDNRYGRDGYRSSDLSLTNLRIIVQYAEKQKLADNMEDNTVITQLLESMLDNEQFRTMRNESAHTITNIDEPTFIMKIGLPSEQFLSKVTQLSSIIIDPSVKKLQGVYDTINKAIEERL